MSRSTWKCESDEALLFSKIKKARHCRAFFYCSVIKTTGGSFERCSASSSACMNSSNPA